jgi:hypothetical protein
MRSILFVLLAAVLVAGLVLPGVSQSQVKVTFIINTSTAPDTLSSIDSVKVTGASAGASGADGAIPRVDTLMTRFGPGLKATNIGGDYWKLTVTFQAKDSVRFKFRVNGDWEDNSTDPNGFSSDNRGVRVGNSDTTLPVMYYNKTGSTQPQYRIPWTAAPDSLMNVYFRVNVQGFIQNNTLSATDTLGVRGGGNRSGSGDFNTPELAWGTTSYLTKESGFLNGYPGSYFWSGRVRIRKSTVQPGDTIKYKFIVNSDWGRSDPNNRIMRVPTGLKDTTVYWSWFTDVRPVGRPNTDTCVVTFRVDLKQAIDKGGFSPGDTVQLQSGFFGTAVETPRTRTLQPVIGSVYQIKDTIITKVGSPLDYQYYLNKLGQSTRENYYNFAYTGPTPNEAEKRQFVVPSKTFTVLDTAKSITSSRRQPEFPNSRRLARKVSVKYEVDLRPAYYQVFLKNDTLSAIQGNVDVTKAVKDSIFKWGVWLNGNAVGGWGNPGGSDWGPALVANLNKKMYDDGTNGDRVAGDSIYTRTVICAPESISIGSKGIVGQIFKFGIKGGDNEGGKGGYGNNHNENIVDTDTAYTISSQWGSINPKFYNAWDFDNKKVVLTGVQELPGLPVVYTLEQNYPNPFNPSTRIEFGIPQQANVELKVYNLLGQEVVTLVHENLKAGRHVVTFDAKNLASGVYFYKISAGQFVSTKKMMLMK